MAGSSSCHVPSDSATTLYAVSFQTSSNFSPLSAQPHTLIGLFLCNTMPSLRTDGSLTAPKAWIAASIIANRSENLFIALKVTILTKLNKISIIPNAGDE